jgi:hypothetical protein
MDIVRSEFVKDRERQARLYRTTSSSLRTERNGPSGSGSNIACNSGSAVPVWYTLSTNCDDEAFRWEPLPSCFGAITQRAWSDPLHSVGTSGPAFRRFACDKRAHICSLTSS